MEIELARQEVSHYECLLQEKRQKLETLQRLKDGMVSSGEQPILEGRGSQKIPQGSVADTNHYVITHDPKYSSPTIKGGHIKLTYMAALKPLNILNSPSNVPNVLGILQLRITSVVTTRSTTLIFQKFLYARMDRARVLNQIMGSVVAIIYRST